MSGLIFNFKHIFKYLAIAFLIAVFPVVFLAASFQRAEAAPGILRQINFQGKLVNTNGTNVANGNYDMVFRLYSVASGGTALWTESRTGANQVAVTDGIFRVSLGSVTAFGALIDWNDDSLFLGVTVGADAEMTPRIRFAAVPYALNAERVAGLTVTNTTGTFTLSAGKTLTVNNTLTFAGTDGTTITFQGTDTYVGRTTTDTLTNKTIGSTGLIFAGAATDIDTAAAEGLTLQGRAASIFQTTAGNITFQAAGTGTTATVQIGAGGAGSTTPDILALDVKSDAGDPAGFNGAMYYNINSQRFRCFQNGAWADCIGTGGGGSTLQGAYDSGNTITTTDNRNIVFTLADTTTDSEFIVDLTCVTCSSGGGEFEIRDSGTAFATFAPDGSITLGKAAAAGTINIGTGTGIDTINIGTGGTAADVITFGNTGVATTFAFNSGATDNALTITANSVTTGTAVQLNATGLTTGNALEITGPSGSTIMAVGRGTDGFNNSFVSIGTTQQRDHLYVQGRINTAYQMWWQDCMVPRGTAAVTANSPLGGFTRSANARLNQPSNVAGASGVCVMDFTGTLAAGNTGYFGSGNLLLTERSLNPVIEARVQITTATDQRVFIGFTNASGTAAIGGDTNIGADQAFFRKSAASTTLNAVTRAASGTETVTTLANGTGTYHVLRVELDNAAAAARFYVNGALVATHTTAVPASTTRLGYYIINNISGTTNRAVNIDYVRVWSDDPPLQMAEVNSGEAAGELSAQATFDAQAVLSSIQEGSWSDDGDQLNLGVMVASQGIVTHELTANSVVLNQLKAATGENIQINSDVVINGILTARKIKADSIEGLEIMTNQISKLKSQNDSLNLKTEELVGQIAGVATTSSGLTPNDKIALGNITIETALIKFDLAVLGKLEARGALIVSGPAVFKSDVFFEGRTTFNNDTAGVAIIKKGADEVEVVFEKKYNQIPLINVSITLDDTAADAQTDEEKTARKVLDQELKRSIFANDIRYIISGRSRTGFTISLNKPAPEDIAFSWHAIAVSDVRMSISKDASGAITSAASTSSPSPAPTGTEPAQTSTPTSTPSAAPSP
jgi:hypothetical protein